MEDVDQKIESAVDNNAVKRIVNKNLFNVLLFVFAMLNVALFAMQSIEPVGFFYADLKSHLDGVSPYSMLSHLIYFFGLIWPKDTNMGLNIIISVLLASANVTSILVTNNFFRKKHPQSNQAIIGMLVMALFLVSMIFPIGTDFKYMGIYTSNVWHSPTYTLCRPFVLLAVFEFFSLYENRSKKMDYKRYVLFLLFVTFSTYAKPSFAVVFVPALAVVLSAELIKTKFKCKNSIIFASLIAAAFLPSLGIIIFQNIVLFDGSSKLVVAWGGAWKSVLPIGGLPAVVLYAVAFPIYAIAVNFKKIKMQHVLMICVYVFGLLAYWLLKETGERAIHHNMAWSYSFGILLMFVASIDLFFFNPNKLWIKIIGYVLFAAHLIYGLIYFEMILSGLYYI